MPKKKPYGNSSQNRKKSLKDKSSTLVDSEEKKFEFTTKIRVDRERLNDFNTLDTSFLEGRIQTKEDTNFKEKRGGTSSKVLFRAISYFIGVVSFFLVFFSAFLFIRNYMMKEEPILVEKEEIPSKKVIDDNYLFVGDSYTVDMNYDDFNFPFPYVTISSSDMKTMDVLDDMRRKIYNYNPSVVVLELGQEDLLQDEEEEDILSNIEEIIKGIQENRPNAKIFVESLYPVNLDFEDLDIDEDIPSSIVHFNEKLEKEAKTLHVSYLDLYSSLADGQNLKKEYTDDGWSLNKKGYEIVYAFLKKNL